MPKPQNKQFFVYQGPIAIAHRGGGYVHGAKRYLKENTLATFEHTRNQGYIYFEIDVISSSDDEVVVVHVAKNKFEAIQGKKSAPNYHDLEAKSYKDLCEYMGRDLPLLKTVLISFPDCKFLIDAKSDKVVAQLTKIVSSNSVENQVCLGSFYPHRVAKMHSLVGNKALYKFVISRSPLHMWRQYKAIKFLRTSMDLKEVYLDFPALFFNRISSAYLRSKNAKPMVWVVNSRRGMNRAIKLKAFGIISDNPQLLKQTILKFNPDSKSFEP